MQEKIQLITPLTNNAITLSVITICYNAAKELEKTIKSVTSQTYPHIEYIIIDGASTDEIPQILERYNDRISHITSEPDKGIYDAMNKGLQRATGTYLCFMNAGDTFHKSTTVSEAFASIPYPLPGVIYGETNLVNDRGEFLRPRRLKAPSQLSSESFKEGMLVCHQSFYARRDLAPLYDLHYKLSADIDWCIKILKRSNVNYNTKLILTDYLHEGVSTKYRRQSLLERFQIMCRHYGIICTLLHHIAFIPRLILKRFIQV